MVWIWLIILLICIAFEVSTRFSMVASCFIPGSLTSLLLSFVKSPLWLQITFFIAISVCCLLIMLLFKIKDKQKQNIIRTNAESLIGQIAKIKGGCDEFNYGLIKIGDIDWRAKSHDKVKIADGKLVKIVGIEGNTLFVIETTYGI